MAAILRPTLREVCPTAVFTLSHVHVGLKKSGDFQNAARWLLPRCRLREAANGVGFEHLHRRLEAPKGPYSYKPQNVGFEPRNVGREPAALAPGGGFAGAAVAEFCWFEEWAGWEGVEKHGGTGHGSMFHSKVDGFIEEEWTFYQAPGAEPVMLPETSSFFNNPAARGGDLHICHFRTSSEDERTALLAHWDSSLSEAQLERRSSSWGAFAVILENKFRRGEFAFIAEAQRDVIRGSLARLALVSRIGEWVKTAPCSEAGEVLRFGPPLWPKDMAMTPKDIDDQGSDEDTFPNISPS